MCNKVIVLYTICCSWCTPEVLLNNFDKVCNFSTCWHTIGSIWLYNLVSKFKPSLLSTDSVLYVLICLSLRTCAVCHQKHTIWVSIYTFFNWIVIKEWKLINMFVFNVLWFEICHQLESSEALYSLIQQVCHCLLWTTLPRTCRKLIKFCS